MVHSWIINIYCNYAWMKNNVMWYNPIYVHFLIFKTKIFIFFRVCQHSYLKPAPSSTSSACFRNLICTLIFWFTECSDVIITDWPIPKFLMEKSYDPWHARDVTCRERFTVRYCFEFPFNLSPSIHYHYKFDSKPISKRNCGTAHGKR